MQISMFLYKCFYFRNGKAGWNFTYGMHHYFFQLWSFTKKSNEDSKQWNFSYALSHLFRGVIFKFWNSSPIHIVLFKLTCMEPKVCFKVQRWIFFCFLWLKEIKHKTKQGLSFRFWKSGNGSSPFLGVGGGGGERLANSLNHPPPKKSGTFPNSSCFARGLWKKRDYLLDI
jgi:hypothetical protein